MISIHNLGNGLTVVVEEIPHVESVAYELQIPGGSAHDEPGFEGGSLILAELTSRGAGHLDSKALSNAFDDLGIVHGEGAGQDRFSYRGTLLAEHLGQALHYLALMVREPTLPEDEVESIRSVLDQDIVALYDNPGRRAGQELSSRHYPYPWNRSSLGTREGLAACNPAHLRRLWERFFRPRGAVLSVAGRVSAPEVLALVENRFGSWAGEGVARPPFGAIAPPAIHHVEVEAAQVQIVFCWPSAKFGEVHFYPAKVAAGILSGGMFGRLFIEVREKRGLCYSVFARHGGTKDFGTMTCYAGTTPERAHETLEVMIREVRALAGTATEEEIARAKANLKASLIIGEESSSARASSNAGDWWLDRRVRGIDELQARIDAVSRADIDAFCAAWPAEGITLLTLGSRQLSGVEAAIS